MPVRIFNNIASLNAQRILGNNTENLARSVERISSGIRINKGSDDAAGLAISEALRSDIRALRQAGRNANDGIAFLNVTEGALNEQSSILIRLRDIVGFALWHIANMPSVECALTSGKEVDQTRFRVSGELIVFIILFV